MNTPNMLQCAQTTLFCSLQPSRHPREHLGWVIHSLSNLHSHMPASAGGITSCPAPASNSQPPGSLRFWNFKVSARTSVPRVGASLMHTACIVRLFSPFVVQATTALRARFPFMAELEAQQAHCAHCWPTPKCQTCSPSTSWVSVFRQSPIKTRNNWATTHQGKQICRRFQQGLCKIDNCQFAHVCAVKGCQQAHGASQHPSNRT